MSIMIKSENFDDLRTRFFNKSDDSDTILHICDIGQSIERLEIHSHLLVLKSASRYIQSYLTFNLNQHNLNHFSNGQGGLIPTKLLLRLELDFSNGLSNEVVSLFFSLFYVKHFNEEQLKEAIHYHILELYELACYFLFDALVVYIEQYLIATMSLTYFTPLTRFCLTMEESSGNYQIIESKAYLFTRLLQWYQCCIDPSTSFLSYNEGKCDSDYYADHKTTILRNLSQRIKNIDKCQLPIKSITKPNSLITRLQHYHRICPSCLESTSKKNRIGAFSYIELGHLTQTSINGSETYFFRLKKRFVSRHGSPLSHNNANNNTIEMTRQYSHKRQRLNTEEEEDEILYQCDSHITLLSRKRIIDTKEDTYNEKDISMPTEIAKFLTHKPKHCYEGHCDQCNLRKSIYIIVLDITLHNQSLILPPEEMTMQVEESILHL